MSDNPMRIVEEMQQVWDANPDLILYYNSIGEWFKVKLQDPLTVIYLAAGVRYRLVDRQKGKVVYEHLSPTSKGIVIPAKKHKLGTSDNPTSVLEAQKFWDENPDAVLFVHPREESYWKSVSVYPGGYFTLYRGNRYYLHTDTHALYFTVNGVKGQIMRPANESQKDLQAPQALDSILTERGSRYGKFKGHALITQQFKQTAARFVHDTHGVTITQHLTPSQLEALDMTFHKIGRILNGDPNYADSWVDIAGYTKLVADELEGKST